MFEQVIAYCERTDFSYWAEPINALTNIAFVLAALHVWPQTRGLVLARAMAVILAMIGLGSFLWHTHATGWASLADVLPILMFILVYIYAATRDYLGAPAVVAAIVALGFFPYAFGFHAVFSGVLPGANALYASVAVLIFAYGLWLIRSDTGRGLLIGAAILCLSLGFRMADEVVCARLPIGTHFMWHILNGIMLGWMILVYCRHARAGALAPRAASG
ncbi:ceramidase domain-containing protein [Roseibaca sp. Y0-43]|uniref:ceramidase domain-containing protein n=1 Tax=Roseibaca sp. Y0-43 TaxID=2816854 RepID=UPI001D0C242A|nr:ceramidase domain-containing protein [Roseibaca sp. Y0-43]MCC1482335.1 ceramidase domain-containing protein [Roseibaca sp. Y0-43]